MLLYNILKQLFFFFTLITLPLLILLSYLFTHLQQTVKNISRDSGKKAHTLDFVLTMFQQSDFASNFNLKRMHGL